ncbi:40-residue YVTN family beta-propeller repeat-containing protein [Parageobacillus thermantarcticus]|uniref:40-residue YVTN family beta-propeller repeat-containing protein n=1 Tax=Parageobacillus thermantarcticus TaxID=186116 RepID=A0A1I0TD72_9BACL|nr:YncE family protein [Parageobacillus thermantarcticus]SFA49657.1 40-residue YVTN family beta-propeller repeat-containing protein [Parageobacillus thermantarcticus]
MRKMTIALLTLLAMFTLILGGCGTNSQKSNTTLGENKQSAAATKGQRKETKKYYFTANEGGSISKIDLETNKVVSTIKVEGSVHNVQVSPDGKILGATLVPGMQHGNDHSMEMKGMALFYNTETDELIKKVEVGNHPAHIVFTENGKYALVTNNEDNNVSVIDMASYSVIQTIPTGKGPHGFRISKDSRYAYIANMGEDSVSILNLETMKEEKKIKVGSTPVTTGITSDGKTLAVTLNKENALAIVDLASGKVEKVPVGRGPAQVYMDPDDTFAYVAIKGRRRHRLIP